MKKQGVTILLTVLVFLSAVLLGVSTVFRVDSLEVEFYGEAGGSTAQATALQTALLEEYERECTFFVSEKKAKKSLESEPYLRVTDFKKRYPNELVVRVVQDVETYAVASGNGYYIVGSDGVVIDVRQTPLNPLTQALNMTVIGLEVTGKKGEVLQGDGLLPTVLTFCNKVDGELSGIRKNIALAEMQVRGEERVLILSTVEGVKLYIFNPDVLTEEKATKAVDEYLSLSDGQKTRGCVSVRDIDGVLTYEYYEKDSFTE